MNSRRRRFVPAALALSLLFTGFESEAKSRSAPPQKPSLTARSYAVIDMSDGAILHGKLPNKRLPPASTAKVMTVLVAMKFLPSDFPVPPGFHEGHYLKFFLCSVE